jgi:hypothetical protein
VFESPDLFERTTSPHYNLDLQRLLSSLAQSSRDREQLIEPPESLPRAGRIRSGKELGGILLLSGGGMTRRFPKSAEFFGITGRQK